MCILFMLKQVAAGNKNRDARNTSPASAALVNTVGATNIADERYTHKHKDYTSGSNYGEPKYVF